MPIYCVVFCTSSILRLPLFQRRDSRWEINFVMCQPVLGSAFCIQIKLERVFLMWVQEIRVRFSLARVDSVSKRTGRRTHRVLHGYDARRKRAKREIACERSRVFIIRLCHHRKKKLQRRAIRLGSLRQFNTRREEKEMRVRGWKMQKDAKRTTMPPTTTRKRRRRRRARKNREKRDVKRSHLEKRSGMNSGEAFNWEVKLLNEVNFFL